MAAGFIKPGDAVLDIGAADGALFRQLPRVGRYVGVDPDLDASKELAANARLAKGLFPQAIPNEDPFDCVVMLAVLEHIPAEQQRQLVADFARYLKPGGKVILTVPSGQVDRILDILKKLHLIDGMALEEHHGFAVADTMPLFTNGGFRLIARRRFQLGLNNLFVFSK